MAGAIKRTTTNYSLKVVNFDYPYWGQHNGENLDVMDALLYAATGINAISGVWQNAYAYVSGDRVVDATDGVVRECLLNHTSASTGSFSDDRTSNPTYWGVAQTVLVNAGAWTTATAYELNELVEDGARVGIILGSYTSDSTYDVDVAAGNIHTLIDLTTQIASVDAALDEFTDLYLGTKTSDPTLDNDGDPLATGALYWNSTNDEMNAYDGAAWQTAYLPAGAYLTLTGGAMTGAITTTSTFDGRDVAADGVLLDEIYHVHKLNATVAPTANSDAANTDGNGIFSVGSRWIDVTGDESYICVDSTATAAVWITQTLTISELGALAPLSTVSATEIDNEAVTLAKMADLAQDTMIGRATASTGVPEVITVTAAGRALLDDANAAAQLVTLGAQAAISNNAVTDAVQAYTKQQNATAAAITSTSNSIAWDLDDAQAAKHTATENTTLANPTNMVDGGTYTFTWTQHASAAKTLAYGSAYTFPGDDDYVVSDVVDSVCILTFICDGTTMRGVGQDFGA